MDAECEKPFDAERSAPRVHAGAFCEGGELGPFCVVEAGAYVGPAARVGAHCRVGANACVEGTLLEGATVEAGAYVPAHVTVGARATVLAGRILAHDLAARGPTPAGKLHSADAPPSLNPRGKLSPRA